MKKKKEEQKAIVISEEEAQKTSQDNIFVLSKEVKETPYNETIDKERLNIFKVYKNTQRINTILMFIAVAFFIAAFIMISRIELALQIVGWVLVGVTVVGLLVYYLLTRNLYPNTSKKYFHVFWKESNEYLFDNKKFHECKIDVLERYNLADVLADRVYKDAVDIASRNIVRGKYNELPFEFGELAYYKAGQKKRAREVIFVGRHLSFENKYHFEDRYIINIKNEKGIDLPNDIEDLAVLSEHNNFVIYGKEGRDPVKDLGKELINNLKSIECVGSLLNVAIVFWAGRTACYLSYDDTIVAIPFDKPLDVSAYAALKKNIEDMFEILTEK